MAKPTDGDDQDDRSRVALEMRKNADFAAWAADAEAERAALLSTPEEALAALGLGRGEVNARARALRSTTRRPNA